MSHRRPYGVTRRPQFLARNKWGRALTVALYNNRKRKLDTFDSLLDGVLQLTDPSTPGFAFTRAGGQIGAVSETALSANEPDALLTAGLNILGVFGGAVSVAPANQGNWPTSFKSGTSVILNVGNITTYTQVVAGDRCYNSYGSIALVLGETYTATIKVIANTLSQAENVFQRAGAIPLIVPAGKVGTFIVTWVDDGASSFMRIGPGVQDTAVTGSITIAEVMVTQKSSAYPPPLEDAPVNAAYDPGVAIIAGVDWSLYRGVLSFVVPFYWGSDENPVDPAPFIERMDAGWFNRVSVSTINIEVTGNNSTPTLNVGVNTFAAGEARSVLHGWSGVVVEGQWNDEQLVSGAETNVPNGTFSVGHSGGGANDAQIHGAVVAIAIPNEYTPEQVDVLRLGGIQRMASWATGAGWGPVAKLVWWGDSMVEGFSGNRQYNTLISRLNPNTQGVMAGLGGDESTDVKIRFLADTITKSAVWKNIIWVGHNNPTETATVLADVAAMVAALGHTNYVVMGVMVTSDVTAINDVLASTYGTKYIDPKARAQSETGDPSYAEWRVDSIHLNQTGLDGIASWIIETLGLPV